MLYSDWKYNHYLKKANKLWFALNWYLFPSPRKEWNFLRTLVQRANMILSIEEVLNTELRYLSKIFVEKTKKKKKNLKLVNHQLFA